LGLCTSDSTLRCFCPNPLDDWTHFISIFFAELSLSQIASEFGSSREPEILNVKCNNLRVIIEKVHRYVKRKEINYNISLLFISIRAVGSAAMNICLVAEGCCDAYFEYGVHIWDYGKEKFSDFNSSHDLFSYNSCR
jgi:hypothetical protein